MGIRAVNIQENELGFEISTPSGLFFFGKKPAQQEALKAHYKLNWARIKQVHSDGIVHSPTKELTNADAHWTHQRGLALAILTADCSPILLMDPVSGAIAAIHAGWRGVAARIVPKTIATLAREGTRSRDLVAVIGPHIQWPSFEVDEDVRDKLVAASDETADLIVHQKPGEKPHVDLNAILKSQLQGCGLGPDQVFDLHLDTKADDRFHSYRRDREKAGRQLSFVSLSL